METELGFDFDKDVLMSGEGFKDSLLPFLEVTVRSSSINKLSLDPITKHCDKLGFYLFDVTLEPW